MTEEQRIQEIQKLMKELHRHFEGDYTKIAFYLAGELVAIPDVFDRKSSK